MDPHTLTETGISCGHLWIAQLGIGYPLQHSWASFVAQIVKNLPAMRATWVWSLGLQRFGHVWTPFTFTWKTIILSTSMTIQLGFASWLTESWCSLFARSNLRFTSLQHIIYPFNTNYEQTVVKLRLILNKCGF